MMPTLLHLDASPRSSDRSRSRRLTAHFAAAWRAHHPRAPILHRDLAATPLPHLDPAWIAAAFTPSHLRTTDMRSALALSDHLTDEFLAADQYLLGVPMYNFGVPSALKAWIDHIIRVDRTFSFNPDDPAGQFYKPLVPPGRRMTLIITTGDAGYEPEGPLWRWNHVEPHLRTLFAFVGITDLTFIYSGNDEFGGEKLARSLDNAMQRILSTAAPALPPSGQ